MAVRRTPRNQALLVAIIVFLIYAAGSTAIYLLNPEGSIYYGLILGIILFIFTYLIIHRFFVDFIEKKINPIYKTIQSVTTSKSRLRKKIAQEDMADQLDNEVKSWAKDQTDEIRQLREMERYRKDFLGNVSHELKTPIFNIQGYILTLLDGGIDDKQINKLYLKRAEKSVNRMITIVDDLVSISRIESGEFKIEKRQFNIVKLVEEVFESHEMLAKNFKVKLEFDSNYKSVSVMADRKRILEALNNLIVNSIKYGKPNGKTKVGFVDTGETILVDITDNGIGISEEDLPRIFERFYRADKSRSRDSGGTGLGLAIVKHVIQAHDQTINVRSGLGKGTSFVFSLEKA